MPGSDDETIRRKFLFRLEQSLHQRGAEGLSWEYRRVPRIDGRGQTLVLIVHIEGAPGDVQVMPLRVHGDYAMDMMRTPIRTIREFDVVMTGHGIASGAGPHAEYLLGTDGADVADHICAWRDAWRDLPSIVIAPLGESDLAPLRTLADARRRFAAEACVPDGTNREQRIDAWKALGLEVGAEGMARTDDLTAAACAAFTRDLDHLSARRALANFPRDARGRLELGETVLLATYACTQSQGRDRQMWLAARGPARRRDPQVVTLELTALIGNNHAHRWEHARWLWDERAASANEEARWGVANLDIGRLGLDDRATHLARFERACDRPGARLADRVARCILLQDEGRVDEAMAVFGVELSGSVQNILHGRVIKYQHVEAWTCALNRELRAAAPWRFEAALKHWAATKGGGHKPLRRRLFALPHQAFQSKASLMLVGERDGSAPRLEIESTASNFRLPQVEWRRPLDLDLARFGLA